jgi:hypothetical protein
MPKPARPPDSTEGFSVELCDGQILFDLGSAVVSMSPDEAKALAVHILGIVVTVQDESGFVVTVENEAVTVRPLPPGTGRLRRSEPGPFSG